ncbi:OmpL47-type beta-barrel domain-containing protein [Actinokineospora soli]|uniref:OmpL47-type beta-barrel domain-containing protein n=1 Tax=Actinokineospora soli TaxID=1048753 RepID=A0ABW2TRM2_9PSEU
MATTEYRIGTGAWQPYTAPFTVPGEGTHTIEYRATDRGGRTSTPGTLTVKVDATAPTAGVFGLYDGMSYGHAVEQEVRWTTLDNASGVASATATLDGAPLSSGTVVAMRTLALGDHRLALKVTDRAGNVRDQVVTFKVVTSIPDLQALVDYYDAENLIDPRTSDQLDELLDKSRRALRSGDTTRAIRHLEEFRTQASRKVTDPAARTLLVNDATAVIAALRG